MASTLLQWYFLTMAIEHELPVENPAQGARILVVDDEPMIQRVLERMLVRSGFIPTICSGVEEALDVFRRQDFDAVLSDVKMDRLGGFDLLKAVQEHSPEMQVVLITGDATIDKAKVAVEQGAFDYLSKPVRLDKLTATLENAIRTRRAILSDASESRIGNPGPIPALEKPLIGRSQGMLDAFRNIARAARTDATVLVRGESGTGKERVALELHRKSPRAAKPFIAVNVNAITPTLAESALFGHVRGAFTDAREDREGFFAAADGGTLFLDEIGELDTTIQVKLLRTLQERTFQRVGDTKETPVDIRLVSATNKDLPRLMQEGKFREDFFFRINVVDVNLPPLRERENDVILIAEYLLARQWRSGNQLTPRLTSEAQQVMLQYAWPGNVRELENVIQRASTFCTHGVITPDLLQLGKEGPHDSPNRTRRWVPLKERTEEYVNEVLDHTSNNLTQAAKILGIARRTLQRMAARRRQPD